MYIPAHFEETDEAAIETLVAGNPLATLVAGTNDGLVANHIPLILEKNRLIGHIALANDLHRLLEDNAPVLAIFQGGEAYISPNWYPSKANHHKHVPTWNYQVVHIHGAIQFDHDTKVKRAVVGRLTKKMESETNGGDAWRMSDAPVDFMETMLDGIVAFDIEIKQILGKTKLSQNRDGQDFDNVEKELSASGSHALADQMADIRSKRS